MRFFKKQDTTVVNENSCKHESKQGFSWLFKNVDGVVVCIQCKGIVEYIAKKV